MRFNVPEGYSMVFQGQIVQSVGGVIETNDKTLIDQLSQNPRAKAEQPKRQALKPDDK